MNATLTLFVTLVMLNAVSRTVTAYPAGYPAGLVEKTIDLVDEDECETSNIVDTLYDFPLDTLQDIQKIHFDIIRIDRHLDRELNNLMKMIEKGLKEEEFSLEDAKQILGWREVQKMYNYKFDKEIDRKTWSWEGSPVMRFGRFMGEGPKGWFSGLY